MCLSLVDGLMMNMVFPWKNPWFLVGILGSLLESLVPWWNPWFLGRLLPQEIKMSLEKGPF